MNTIFLKMFRSSQNPILVQSLYRKAANDRSEMKDSKIRYNKMST